MLKRLEPIVNQPPRLIASPPMASGIVWLAQGICCPCGELVSQHARPTADGGVELNCTDHHTVLRFECAE